MVALPLMASPKSGLTHRRPLTTYPGPRIQCVWSAGTLGPEHEENPDGLSHRPPRGWGAGLDQASLPGAQARESEARI